MSIKHSVYKTIAVIEGVQVKVPKESGFMRRMPGFKTKETEVRPYWANGKPLVDGGFLNAFFHNTSREVLGTEIPATVEVILKTTPTGQAYTMINMLHTPGVVPSLELKLPEKPNGGKVFPILNSRQNIEFRTKKSYARK